MSNNWKKVEYKVARLLGGKRVPVSGRAEVMKGDVDHPRYFIEVKYGKQIPKRVLEWDKQIEIGHKILKNRFDGILIVDREVIPKKIMDWFNKAEKESPEGKIVLLVMKPKYCHKEFVLYRKNGAFAFTTLNRFIEIEVEEKEEYEYE